MKAKERKSDDLQDPEQLLHSMTQGWEMPLDFEMASEEGDKLPA